MLPDGGNGQADDRRAISVKDIAGVDSGIYSELLNRYTAQALRRPVRIGAGEGTVIGNLLVQAMSLGDVKDLWELRGIVRDSFGDREYGWDPAQDDKWEKDYQKLRELMKA